MGSLMSQYLLCKESYREDGDRIRQPASFLPVPHTHTHCSFSMRCSEALGIRMWADTEGSQQEADSSPVEMLGSGQRQVYMNKPHFSSSISL